jgi:G patch domain-containing protein 1
VEDFMDDEDMEDAEEARKLGTAETFTGLGSTEQYNTRSARLLDFFRPDGETMGVKLLKRMGWREGQGIGPRIRRAARTGLHNDETRGSANDTFLFAPDDVSIIGFHKKNDRRGLGFEDGTGLGSIANGADGRDEEPEPDEIPDHGRDSLNGNRQSTISKLKSKEGPKKTKGSFGMGILNDTGSDDDDDPYSMGPRISYNRVIGGEKKKAKKATMASNAKLTSQPILLTRKSGKAKGLQRCHDGRLPLEGFVFGHEPDPLVTSINDSGRFPPPEIPDGWVSARQAKVKAETAPFVSTADAARASTLDPKSRAALLGETQLKGKSVFDFLDPSARQRLASATGRTDLPQVKSEVPDAFRLTDEEKTQSVLQRITRLDRDTAMAALARGAGPGAPYADDEEKRARYRSYLEYEAGSTKILPVKPSRMSDNDWERELNEFHSCARIFKPMRGMMASRFTSATHSKLSTGSSGEVEDGNLVAKPAPKATDPAEDAAALGMFGPMTRSVADFYPSRLLCKRFNVKPPAHVQPDQEMEGYMERSGTDDLNFASGSGTSRNTHLALAWQHDEGLGPASRPENQTGQPAGSAPAHVPEPDGILDTTRNAALEGKRAGEEVFRAIFGDSDDDE